MVGTTLVNIYNFSGKTRQPRLTPQNSTCVLTLHLRAAAHSLKGAISNFYVSSATQAALSLEIMGKEGNFDGASDKLQALERELTSLRGGLRNLLENTRNQVA